MKIILNTISMLIWITATKNLYANLSESEAYLLYMDIIRWESKAAKESDCSYQDDVLAPPYACKKDGLSSDGNPHIGDSNLFNGFLCASGNEKACDSVKRSQGSDGRWWRAPNMVGYEDHPENANSDTFSKDAFYGTLHYILHKNDQEAMNRLVEYMDGISGYQALSNTGNPFQDWVIDSFAYILASGIAETANVGYCLRDLFTTDMLKNNLIVLGNDLAEFANAPVPKSEELWAEFLMQRGQDLENAGIFTQGFVAHELEAVKAVLAGICQECSDKITDFLHRNDDSFDDLSDNTTEFFDNLFLTQNGTCRVPGHATADILQIPQGFYAKFCEGKVDHCTFGESIGYFFEQVRQSVGANSPQHPGANIHDLDMQRFLSEAILETWYRDDNDPVIPHKNFDGHLQAQKILILKEIDRRNNNTIYQPYIDKISLVLKTKDPHNPLYRYIADGPSDSLSQDLRQLCNDSNHESRHEYMFEQFPGEFSNPEYLHKRSMWGCIGIGNFLLKDSNYAVLHGYDPNAKKIFNAALLIPILNSLD